jgi:RNA polymerase sigma factor (sigma-70 family)
VDSPTPNNVVTPLLPGRIDWEKAYRRYCRFWISLARGNGLSETQARDAVHAVLLVLLGDPNREFESQEHIRNYVARAVINRASVERRRPDRAATSAEVFESAMGIRSDCATSADRNLLEAERDVILREALLSLPRKGFEIIKLRFYCGFTFLEMSQILHKPISTLKSREDAALRQLRRSLWRRGIGCDVDRVGRER